GRRRRAGEAVELVLLFQPRLQNFAVPQNLAAGAFEAEEHALLLVLDAAGHEHAVAEDDRRRVADAGDLDLPRDVLGGAPAGREVLLGRGAVQPRAAPRGPVLGAGGGGEDEQRQSGGDEAV